MITLGWALVWLAATFALHVVWWRWRLPRAQSQMLLLLFLVSGMICCGVAYSTIAPDACRLFGWIPGIQLAMFQLSMALAYVEAYTAIEEDSPSMTILLFVAAAADRGCTAEQLLSLIPDEAIVGVRLQALLTSGLVSAREERLLLTTAGRRWAELFRLTRQLYGLPLGG